MRSNPVYVHVTYINRGLDGIKLMCGEYDNVVLIIGIDNKLFESRSFKLNCLACDLHVAQQACYWVVFLWPYYNYVVLIRRCTERVVDSSFSFGCVGFGSIYISIGIQITFSLSII